MLNKKLNSTLFSHKNYKKNEIIKNEGDECLSIGIIIEGNIKISNITFDSKEFIIDSLHHGDFFGETLIFSKNNFYPGSIISTTNTKIAFINKTDFIKLLQNDNCFLNFYLDYISQKYINLQNKIKLLSQSTIKEKFLFYLQMELSYSNQNYVIIKSISELAGYLNVPRPSLSRIISQLVKEKIIIKNNNTYYINKA